MRLSYILIKFRNVREIWKSAGRDSYISSGWSVLIFSLCWWTMCSGCRLQIPPHVICALSVHPPARVSAPARGPPRCEEMLFCLRYFKQSQKWLSLFPFWNGLPPHCVALKMNWNLKVLTKGVLGFLATLRALSEEASFFQVLKYETVKTVWNKRQTCLVSWSDSVNC